MNVIELELLTAEGLTNSLLKFLADVGFTEYYLRRNWQAFASDGDSIMLGTKSGMATRLCEKYPNPLCVALFKPLTKIVSSRRC